MVMTVPTMAELQAAPSWRTVDFISDLHLHPEEPATFLVWLHYLHGTPADAVFILGDLFEAWVGDDVIERGGEPAENFEQRCAQALKTAGLQRPLFFMHGNRDFLVGQALMQHCGATLLADPTVFSFAGQRWLLSHGDALCLGDVDYLRFRALVRAPDWQENFLAKPLAERQAIARELRQQSEARKNSGLEYADIDPDAARQWLHAASAHALIHGHTHKPGSHALGEGMSRTVLSDWDAQAAAPRAQVLRLSAEGLKRIELI